MKCLVLDIGLHMTNRSIIEFDLTIIYYIIFIFRLLLIYFYRLHLVETQKSCHSNAHSDTAPTQELTLTGSRL